jgi:DNA-binding transcriptional LysR family regulator
MDRLTAMATFAAVADRKGFAPAARQLNMSPPAVTRMIAALEAELSIQLFARTTRSVALTDAGARYLVSVRRILTDVAEAERTARAERTEPTGRVMIAAPNVFGRREVAPLVCEYLRTYPAVSCELALADRMVNFIDDGIDLAVRIGALKDSTLRSRVVGATRRVLVASPGYLAQRKPLRSPADLAAHTLIQFSAVAPTAEWTLVRGTQEHRIAIAPRLVTNDADAAIGHALRDGGITMALSYQVATQLKAGTLVLVLEKFRAPTLPIALVYPGTRMLSASIRAFIDLVVATAAWDFD